jgi:uncharacterized protein (DUF924 family)
MTKGAAMKNPGEVVEFWRRIGAKGWFEVNAEVDEEIRTRFMGHWGEAWEGGLREWQVIPEGMLAYLIVTDQFPRNMFRGDARSFATDDRARAAARRAVLSGLDMQIAEAERSFVYLPFEHAESMGDQDWSVDLYENRLFSSNLLLHAKSHREVIRRFGRFPYRNAALGRKSSPAEQAFLEAGGYGSILREFAV